MLEATVPPDYDAALAKGYRAIRFGIVPAARGVSRLRDAHGTSLSMLLGLTGLVLLMASSNLATLVIARASAREREVAVRIAIGATRRRIVSQLFAESLLMAATGSALAVPIALMSGRALVAFFETSAGPIDLNLTASWRLAAYVAAAAVLTGLLPVLRLSLIDPIVAMRRASRGVSLDRRRGRLQNGLVVAQVATSLVLIFSALLFVQTFRNSSRSILASSTTAPWPSRSSIAPRRSSRLNRRPRSRKSWHRRCAGCPASPPRRRPRTFR